MRNIQPPMQNHHRVPVKCETINKRNKKKRNTLKRNGIYQNKPKSKRNENHFAYRLLISIDEVPWLFIIAAFFLKR